VLAHLAAQVRGLDRRHAAAAPGADGGCPQRRVVGEVPVVRPGQPVARVLATPQRDQRAVASPDRTSLDPVALPRRLERPRGVDDELRNGRLVVEEL
jgi:hypothetical protein